MMMLFNFSNVFSQTITIGTGALTSATTDNGNPIYRSSAASGFTFAQSVHLLTNAQLTAAGLTAPKSITSMAFYKTSTNTLSAGRTATLRIYMKSSTASALVGTQTFSQWVSGATLVYNNTNVIPSNLAATGAVTFPFSTPFIYDGTGGIEIAVDWSVNTGTGNPATGPFQWTYNTTTPIQTVGTSSSVAITGALASTQLRSYRMNLTLAPPPSCLPAAGLNTTGLTNTSATLNWNASPSAPSGGYEYEVRTSGAAGSGAAGLVTSGTTGAGVLTQAVSGLTANTSYTFYVRANCGAGDFSTWSASPAFFTGYCIATSTGQASWISAFSTSGGTANINYSSPTAATGTGGYQNLTATNSVSGFVGGSSIGLSMTAGGPTCVFWCLGRLE